LTIHHFRNLEIFFFLEGSSIIWLKLQNNVPHYTRQQTAASQMNFTNQAQIAQFLQLAASANAAGAAAAQQQQQQQQQQSQPGANPTAGANSLASLAQLNPQLFLQNQLGGLGNQLQIQQLQQQLAAAAQAQGQQQAQVQAQQQQQQQQQQQLLLQQHQQQAQVTEDERRLVVKTL
jgi:flagellar motor protein MotB